MNFGSIQIEHCYQCKSKDVVTCHLLEWNSFDPDLVACCADRFCKQDLYHLKCKTNKLTALSLVEAQLLLIKSRL